MTIIEQIKKTFSLKESTELEFKSARGGFPQSFWETLSAFANTNGGIIVLGVKEKDGAYLPDELTDEQIEKYKKQFWDNAHNKSCVNIPLLVNSDVIDYKTEGGCNILIFNVPRAQYDIRPVFLTMSPFGHTYKRHHEGDYQCSDDEVRQMFSDANNIKNPADSRILKGYSINDIDMPTLRQYRQRYKLSHENHPWNDVDDMKFLENIGAYRKNRQNGEEGFTVAGLLMFGKNNSITDPECCPNFFVDYRERLSLEKDIKWTNRVYPDGTWEANLYQFFSIVLPMIQHALPVPYKLNENMQRIDTTSAHAALREAFANTIIHCSYTTLGNITIDRYYDRIVMSNPGTMLVSIEEYHEGCHSVCRNPLLQKMFVLIGIGEKAGSGADIISKGWNDNGWDFPSIEERQFPCRVETILKISEFAETTETTGETTETTGETTETTDKTTETTNKTTETTDKTTETTDKTTETTDKTTETQAENAVEKILVLIKQNPNITTKQLSVLCSITEDGVYYNIKKLKKQGIIRRVNGSRNGGYWEVL